MQASAWQRHVQKTRAKYGCSFKEALQLGSRTYKKQGPMKQSNVYRSAGETFKGKYVTFTDDDGDTLIGICTSQTNGMCRVELRNEFNELSDYERTIHSSKLKVYYMLFEKGKNVFDNNDMSPFHNETMTVLKSAKCCSPDDKVTVVDTTNTPQKIASKYLTKLYEELR